MIQRSCAAKRRCIERTWASAIHRIVVLSAVLTRVAQALLRRPETVLIRRAIPMRSARHQAEHALEANLAIRTEVFGAASEAIVAAIPFRNVTFRAPSSSGVGVACRPFHTRTDR